MPAAARTTALLLPGIDGSGRLYAPLLAAAPRRLAPIVLSYPPDEPLGLDALVARVRAALPRGRFVLVAESFSGPVAIRIAAERPPGLVALVLAATFLHRPLSPLLHPLRGLVGARMFGLRMPAPLVRHFMAGHDAPDALVADVQAAVAAVRADVLALRALESQRDDVRDELAAVVAPLHLLDPARVRLNRTDVVKDVLAVRPDAEVALIDAPHMVLQRAPHACLARIEAFLQRPRARAGAVA